MVINAAHKRTTRGRRGAPIAVLAAAALFAPSFAFTGEPEPGAVSLDKGPATEAASAPLLKPTVDIRARYEYGDTASRDISHAETVRARLGVLTRAISGFQAFAEFEGTLPADRDSYQAASVHGLGGNKTIIADPASHEVNQLWLSYAGFEDVTLKAGRQRIILDNARSIGNVGWRQNEQTYDAARLDVALHENLDLVYGYVARVARIFGSEPRTAAAQEDFEGNSHLANLRHTGLPIGTLTGYAYLLDLGNRSGEANSNQSFGFSLGGPLPLDRLSYYFEYGHQKDAYHNPAEYEAHYVHAILTAAMGESGGASLGYERLGSDNGVGYNFPLGTNHVFNGYADVFLATPANGLQDIYVSANRKLPWWELGTTLAYHKFYSASGGSDYGNEIDFVVTKDLGRGFSVLGKYAYYWAEDAPFVDTNRFSVEVNYKF